MNYSVLLRRAFDITRRYRVLWLFGILVALTSGGGSSSFSNSGYNFDGGDLPNWAPLNDLGRWLDGFDPSRYVGVFIACCCLVLILAVVALIVQYVARAALIRGVDQIETTGAAPTWRAGFRLGWNGRTFRLFLFELIVGILVFLVAMLLAALVASPLLLLLTQSDAARVIGIALAALLAVPFFLLLIAAGIAFSVLGQFWSREIVLADLSIGEALTRGYALVRARLKDVGVLWLLTAGIEIGFTILMIPVFFVLVALGALVGGGLGYAIYSLSNSVGWAIGVGLPIFVVILGIPLTFIGGLYAAFKSSAWTLAYREVAPPSAT